MSLKIRSFKFIVVLYCVVLVAKPVTDLSTVCIERQVMCLTHLTVFSLTTLNIVFDLFSSYTSVTLQLHYTPFFFYTISICYATGNIVQ